MDLMWLFGGALVIAFVVLVVMVAVSTRNSRPRAATQEPERDLWEEQLLANTPDAPTPGTAPTVLDRDALGSPKRPFDPGAWDDRPDGYEGTDFGLVGEDK